MIDDDSDGKMGWLTNRCGESWYREELECMIMISIALAFVLARENIRRYG